MEPKEALEMLSDSEKPLDINALVVLIELQEHDIVAYRVYMRNKIVGIAEIVLPSFHKEVYLAELVVMTDESLFAELDRLGILLSEKMAVPPVITPVFENRSVGLARLAEFKV